MGTTLALPQILKHTLAQRPYDSNSFIRLPSSTHNSHPLLPPPSPEGSFTLQSKVVSRHPKERHVTHSHGNTHQHERKLEATRPTFATQHFHYNSMVIPYPKRHRQAFKTEASQLYDCAGGVGRKAAVTKPPSSDCATPMSPRRGGVQPWPLHCRIHCTSGPRERVPVLLCYSWPREGPGWLGGPER